MFSYMMSNFGHKEEEGGKQHLYLVESKLFRNGVTLCH